MSVIEYAKSMNVAVLKVVIFITLMTYGETET